MFRFGSAAAKSIAVLSYLASAPARGRCDSIEIATACKLSRALTAKILSRLSGAGMVRGRPGPGGGYALTRAPGQITLLQVVSLTRSVPKPGPCSTCRDRQGRPLPCPLGELFSNLRIQYHRMLENTTLDLVANVKAACHP